MKERNIPTGWKKVKLGEVLKEVNERNKGEKVKRVLSVTNSRGFVSQEEYFEGTVHSANISNYKIVRKNQFAYNPSRVNVGSIDILKDYEDGALSPMYIVFEVDTTKLLPDYFKYYFQTNRFFENVKNNTQGSVRNSLSFKALADFDYLLPPIEEQVKIIKILKNVESLIDINKKYIKNITKAKEEIFDNFLNQNYEWQNKTFSEVFDMLPNNSFSRDKLNYEKGIYKNIHYGDILTKYNEIVDIEENDYIPFINDEEINNKACVILKDRDVIIADTAEDETVGKAVEVINVKNKKVLSGLHTIACRPNLKFANGYLGFYINSKEYHKQLIPLMQGIKVLGITKNNIKRKTRIKFPNLEIQNKIVIIMQNYNEKIKLLEKKLEEYEKMKKALMQKLLTGKVRVKI